MGTVEKKKVINEASDVFVCVCMVRIICKQYLLDDINTVVKANTLKFKNNRTL